MTTGQRIAAKRKERELSQESLGAELGVSRQTVYKWESDTSLPEIEKLVALSRLFQVPVGWLLGVEGGPGGGGVLRGPAEAAGGTAGPLSAGGAGRTEPGPAGAGGGSGGGKLSGSQRPRRRWPWVLAALAVVWAGWSVFSRLDRMDGQYNSLANSVNNVSHSVNAQVGSIASRVEEILKAQNDLTQNYATQLVSRRSGRKYGAILPAGGTQDPIPPGMSVVVFLADSGGEVREMEAAEEESRALPGRWSVPDRQHYPSPPSLSPGTPGRPSCWTRYQGGCTRTASPGGAHGSVLCDVFEAGENGRFALPGGYVTVGGGGPPSPWSTRRWG